MTIEWLAGNRLRGTTAERPALGLPSGSVGGWVEVARTTLGSNSTSFTVSSIPDKRYYFVLINPEFTNAGSGNSFRLGSGGSEDSGSNYAYRRSTNGGNDVTGINQSSGIIPIGGYSTEHELLTMHIANKSDKEKLCIHDRCYSIAGAGNAPLRIQQTSKWTNTSNAIDMMKATLNSSGGFASGTEIVVLGWDPSDSHTTNFWEELASVELSSAGDTLSSGTFTAKKYLWVQAWAKVSPATGAPAFRVGNSTIDTTSTYATRASSNGATDDTATSTSNIDMAPAFIQNNETCFVNIHIINKSDKEKLMIWETVQQGTAGTLNATARRFGVAKWTNTSSQIDIVSLINAGSGDFSNGTIKVWGSD